MVKFCAKCHNLYRYEINQLDTTFSYKCPLCGHTEDISETCIIVNELDRKINDYPLNPNMIYDYTLPRTRQIKCPNNDCASHKGEKNPEIIVFQYNPEMLNVGYMCSVCRNYWKN
jgi:hypothetical protein